MKNNTHMSGEYFVAAELYRRGFEIGMTIGNAKSIDLVAIKSEKTIKIQVKALANKKGGNWPISSVDDDVLYIFVLLNDISEPTYYICNNVETKDNLTFFKTRSGIFIKSLDNPDFKNRWDKIS